MSEPYVIVHRTPDPVQADMLGDLLRENGIAARVLGTRHGALIGVGQHILQLHIEVPQSQAGEATDFLEAFYQGQGTEDLGEMEDDEDDEAAADRRAPSAPHPLFAAGASLVFGVMGGGHLYGRRPFTAAVLLAGMLIASMHIWTPDWGHPARGLIMLAALLVLDLVGSQVAVRAYARGIRPSPLRQLATGAVFLALAWAVSAVIGPPMPEGERQRPPAQPMFEVLKLSS